MLHSRSLLAICFKYSSVYMSIPELQFQQDDFLVFPLGSYLCEAGVLATAVAKSK